jgi:hypothetical protein
MPSESRVKRWRANKREQGLKHVSVWLTQEEELRLKDIALQWHCSPSTVMQRSLAQVTTNTPPYIGSPPDMVLIRELIRAELEALGIAIPEARGVVSEGPPVSPTDTKGEAHPETPAPVYEAAPGHSLLTESTPPRKGGRPRSPVGQQILDLLAAHPEGLSADELRVYLKATKPIGDILSGMKKTGAVTTQGEGKPLRYVVVP